MISAAKCIKQIELGARPSQFLDRWRLSGFEQVRQLLQRLEDIAGRQGRSDSHATVSDTPTSGVFSKFFRFSVTANP